MPANLSVILNVLLLIGVVVAIAKVVWTRKAAFSEVALIKPSIDHNAAAKINDDIIAVRKISPSVDDVIPNCLLEPVEAFAPKIEPKPVASINHMPNDESILIILTAKENRQLAGYELLQTLLGAGLRFGEGQLFHRHQYSNGQGPVLCSLAAATPTGQFDLQNIGSFSVKGLCLFMQSSGNPTIDEERFTIMLETAQQLSEDLDTSLLDDRQKPLNESSLARYYTLLNLNTLALVD